MIDLKKFDTDDSGMIESDELGDAGAKFREGEIDSDALGNVSRAYRESTDIEYDPSDPPEPETEPEPPEPEPPEPEPPETKPEPEPEPEPPEPPETKPEPEPEPEPESRKSTMEEIDNITEAKESFRSGEITPDELGEFAAEFRDSSSDSPLPDLTGSSSASPLSGKAGLVAVVAVVGVILFR